MTSFDERLTELRAKFIARSRSERAALAAASERGDLAEIKRVAHSLAGSGGLFGFPEISVAGQDLEAALDYGADAELLKPKCEALLRQLEALVQPD